MRMAAHSFIQCTVRWDIAACVWSAVLSREEIVLMPAVFYYTFSSSESVSVQYLVQFQEHREIIPRWTLRTRSTVSGHQLGEEAREDGTLNMWEHSEHNTNTAQITIQEDTEFSFWSTTT